MSAGAQDEAGDLERRADERFVDALLSGYLGDNAAARAQRVERVARAIGVSASGARSAHRAWRAAVLSGGVLAAGLIALLSTLLAPGSAHASFQRVVDAVTRGDQTYAIEVTLESAPRARRPLERIIRMRRGRPLAPVQRSAESLDGGILYVRGEQYVLVRQNGRWHGAQGFDGEHHWRVHPRAGTETLAGDAPPKLVAEVSDLLLIDLGDVIAGVREEYELADLGTHPARDGMGSVRRYSGRRRSGAERGPSRIELWVDEPSGQPLEIELGGLRGPFSGTRYEVSLRLASQEPLPADWFHAAAHGG